MRKLLGSAIGVVMLAGTASAVDGVLEINQACAVNTGCFAGDTAGFPVTISNSGSYVLTSDLAVADLSHDGIVALPGDVTLDLNGFSVVGPATCTGSGSTLSCSGSGDGIKASSARITVRDGRVRAFGGFAVDVGQRAQIRNVVVEGSGVGIRARARSIVSQSTAYSNAGDGIDVENEAVVEHSIASLNKFRGIEVGRSSSVVGNSAAFNGQFGVFAGLGSVVRENSALGNESDGINTAEGNLVSDNAAYDNDGNGITTRSGSTVQRNSVSLNALYGINVGGTGLISGNLGSGNGPVGIRAGDDSTLSNNNLGNDSDIEVGFRSLLTGNTLDRLHSISGITHNSQLITLSNNVLYCYVGNPFFDAVFTAPNYCREIGGLVDDNTKVSCGCEV